MANKTANMTMKQATKIVQNKVATAKLFMPDNPCAAYSGNQAMHVLFHTQSEPTTGI